MRATESMQVCWFVLGLVACWGAALPAAREPELIRAFAFGSRDIVCPTHNDPGTSYTMVLQGTADDLEYSAARGWGYEVLNPAGAGYDRFGPFDDSANNRAVFPDTCPSELYDSFIGAKNFASPCSGVPVPAVGPCLPSEGIIFRVDVPNGLYRFVAAVGSADNVHTHRVLVENGGSGLPEDIGADHVVLVHNFDQAEAGAGVFARVGFDGLIPPPGQVNGFVDMDQDGFASPGPPDSPSLRVTEGHIRLHQLKAATSGDDPNGGDMVILELWRVEGSFSAISRGSTWSYQQGLQEASAPIDAWRELSFDDGSWARGAAPFGYGDPPFGTNLSLLDPPMQNNYSTLFLRQTFELSNPGAVNQLVAYIDYDDGFLMWVNGVEVLRTNVDGLEGDPVAHNGFASSNHESGTYEEFFLPDPAAYLVPGTNVVAAQVFNTSITSSDLKFDMELFDPVAPDLSPPDISRLLPVAGTTVRSLTGIQVTFTEDVAGVDASDLLVNGVAASSVTGSGQGPFSFSFPAPPEGLVDVSWAAGHGITDQADPPNAFVGEGWAYTVDPDAPLGNVSISEILAVNRTGIRDEDGETSDWLELCNLGSEVVNLFGWSLTDDADDTGKWVLPDVAIGPNEYLVIFTSGKDRTPTSGNLHTNFRLGSTGEYLALCNAESPREVVAEFTPRYPRQRADYSYGTDGTGELVYFQTPTPGAPNAGSVIFDGFVLDPVCTPERGFYDAAFSVAIASVTPGARTRYTLDGSEPTPTRGTFYSGPFQVTGTPRRGVVTLRAIAYLDGLLPSDVVTHTYIFPDHVLTQPNNPDGFPTSWNGQPADYEMDPDVVNDSRHRELIRAGLTTIPTLSVVTDVDSLFSGSRGILANPSMDGVAWERPVSAEFIYPDLREGFQINCGLRVQGGSSTQGWKVIKVSMRLLFKGDYGPTKLRFPLFPDTTVTEFDTIVLDAHMNQTWQHPSHGQRVRAQYVRDQYVSDIQNALGGYAPHDIFAHLYVNGLYWGVFDLHERPDHSYAAEYFGGDKWDYDCLRHNRSTVINGGTSAWNTMFSLARRDLSSNSNLVDLAGYLDIPNLTDYMIANFYVGNDDWPHHNWYATRLQAPGAGYRFHSWDAEHVVKSTTIDRTGVNNSDTPAELYSRLRANAEFRLLFADHVHRHFFNGGTLYVNPSSRAWNPDSPQNNVPASIYMRRIEEIDSYQRRIDEPESVIGSAIACEAARWGDTRRPDEPYTRNGEWLTELSWVLNQYLPNRAATVLNQLRNADLYPQVGAPVFNQHGGRIEPGFVLSISRPAGTSGTIYFTTDGSDPRVFGSGEISESATTYSAPFILNDHTYLKARIRSGTTWSALNEATFTLSDPLGVVRITEIMYNPLGGSDYEFVELQNVGDLTADLAFARFSNGVNLTFTGEASLGPGEFLVIVANPEAFESRYPAVNVGGVYSGNLANGGEKVTFKDRNGDTIVSVDYDDEGFWPVSPDGFGYSLVVRDIDGDFDDPQGWRASADVGGSPGAEDPFPLHGGVAINEVIAGSAPLEDAIELYNFTTSPVDVGGWYLSNSRSAAFSLLKFRIPEGTVIPAAGYAVFYENEFNGNPGSVTSFELEEEGGAVYLSAASSEGILTGYTVEAPYGAEVSGVSFGRFATTTGLDFVAMDERSFGADFPDSVEEFRTGTGLPNAPPRFGPGVINELQYHPADNQEEFVELFNPTASPLPLYDGEAESGWRLHGLQNSFDANSFEFGPGAEIPAQGFLLVVGIDPGVFRDLHAVPLSVPIHGPSSGRLDNGGECVSLTRPHVLENNEVVEITVDHVCYNDKPPWPLSADGSGPSLERIVASSYGNEPVNWGASTRSGGTPGATNSLSGPGSNRPPEALFEAAPASGEAPLEVLLDASQSYDLDGEVVSYGWDFDDGASATGRIVTHTFVDPGVYLVTLTVADDEEATDSATLLVTVEVDPGGLQYPGDSNQDSVLSISDAVSLLRRLFTSPASPPCEGDSLPQGGNETLLNLNGDGGVDVSDVVYLLEYLFRNGPPPVLGTECIHIPGCPDVCAE